MLMIFPTEQVQGFGNGNANGMVPPSAPVTTSAPVTIPSGSFWDFINALPPLIIGPNQPGGLPGRATPGADPARSGIVSVPYRPPERDSYPIAMRLGQINSQLIDILDSIPQNQTAYQLVLDARRAIERAMLMLGGGTA